MGIGYRIICICKKKKKCKRSRKGIKSKSRYLDFVMTVVLRPACQTVVYYAFVSGTFCGYGCLYVVTSGRSL